MKFKVRVSFFLMVMCTIFCGVAWGDIGPKPSITVIVKNHEGEDYLLDVLYDKEWESRFRDEPQEEEILDLYNFEEDGWRPLKVRYDWVSGDLRGEYDKGSGDMIHRLGYRVPKRFKLIIRKSDGTFIKSDILKPNQFDAVVEMDFGSGEASVVRKNLIEKIKDMGREHYFLSLFLLYIVLPIILTAIIELIIARVFGIKEMKCIFWTNILTQIWIQFAMRMEWGSMEYLPNLMIMEGVIVLVEYLIYRKFINSVKGKKLIIYTLLANITTFIIGLFTAF